MGEDSNESGVSPERAANGSAVGSGAMIKVIGIDEERIKGHHDRLARASLEETLNARLGAETARYSSQVSMIDDFAKRRACRELPPHICGRLTPSDGLRMRFQPMVMSRPMPWPSASLCVWP